MTELLSNTHQIQVENRPQVNWYLFFVISGANLVILYLTNRYIVTFGAFERSWSDRLNADELAAYFSQKERMEIFGYFALVTYLLLKYSIITLLLQAAADFSGHKVGFREVFKLVMIAEVVFLVPQSIRVVHFMNAAGYTLDQYNHYDPLSLSALIGSQNSGPWQFALQTLDLWEVLYWVLLADGLRQLLGVRRNVAARLVLCSYIPSLLLWLIMIAFITFTVSR
jgi:hypothetical protein